MASDSAAVPPDMKAKPSELKYFTIVAYWAFVGNFCKDSFHGPFSAARLHLREGGRGLHAQHNPNAAVRMLAGTALPSR
jgi:hypothetical protein